MDGDLFKWYRRPRFRSVGIVSHSVGGVVSVSNVMESMHFGY